VIGGAIPIVPSAEGTGCGTAQFTLNFSTDATTDSGLDGTCNGTDTGLDQFFTWTATSNGLLWNDAAPGNPGIVVRDAAGNEIACAQTFASNDIVLSGWDIGDDLIIQIYDFGTSVSDVAFCLEEYTLATPPANDDCVDAIALTVNTDLDCTTVTPGTIDGATDSGEGDNGTGTPNDDVWYSFTATAETHRIELQNVAGNTTDLAHEVLEGTCGGGLTSLNISDPNTSTITGLTIGNDYFLRIFSWGSTSGRDTTFDVCIGTFPPPPSNDDCANAWTIGVLPHNQVGDATAATNNDGFISECGSGMNDGVWYTFSVAESGTVTIALTGITGWDPEIALYSGSCGAFVCEDSADSGGTGGDETLTDVAVTAGTTYYINIGNWSGTTNNSEGPYTLDVTTSDTTTLSTEDNSLAGFRLFPTVVEQRLNFDALENIEQLSVYNLLGQEVLRTTPNVSSSFVDLSSLKGGVYVVRVQIGTSTGTYKIIKE
jgi:hypothetical protein